MGNARITMLLLVSTALLSFMPGHAAAQACEERLAQMENNLEAIELSQGRRAEMRQVVEQAREMARSGKQEECLRATRHLEFVQASLEDLRSGQHQPGEREMPVQMETGPTAAASAKERLRQIQAARETAVAQRRERAEQAGSSTTGRQLPQGEEELTAALARVREDLARERGDNAQAPAGKGAGGSLPSQTAPADGTSSARPPPQEAGAQPEGNAGASAVAQGPGPCEGSVEVGSGDTLFGIARRCRTTVDALMQANPEIKDPTLIRVGQAIQVPTGADGAGGQQAAQAVAAGPGQPEASGPDAARLEQAGAERDAQVALMKAQAAVRTAGEKEGEPQQAAVATAEEPRSAAAPAAERRPCVGSIEVKSGDTLFSIARRCETTVDALMQANPEIKDPTLIRVGQKIALPAS